MNTSQITSPVPLYTHDVFGSSSSSDKPEPDFQTFGYTFSASSSSRHDRRLSLTSLSSETLPPSYSDSHQDVVPEYAQSYEPTTLAKYLFRYGFLCPLFWLMGSFILISPLRAPPTPENQDVESTMGTWLPEKTDAQREAYISHMRKAELKWAKRCLMALIVFITIIGGIAGCAVWATSK